MTATQPPLAKAITKIETSLTTVAELRSGQNVDYFNGLEDAYKYVLLVLQEISTTEAEPSHVAGCVCVDCEDAATE